MDGIRRIVKQHPVLWFYILAFAFAWGGVCLVIGGPGNIPGTPAQTEALLGPVMLAWFAGPSVSSIVLTALVDGRAGLRALGARLTKWRVGARWYAVALLAGPIVYLAGLLVLSPFYREYIPSILTSDGKLSVVLFGIVAGLIGGGLLEELGWTGFAVPRLRQRHSAVNTALITGVLWGAVHFSFVFWLSGSNVGPLPWRLFLLVRAVDLLVGSLPAFRVLMVWVYERTGSLLVAMLMHAALSASMLILGPQAISGVPFLTGCVVASAASWFIVGAVAITRGLWLQRASIPSAGARTAGAA